MIVGRENLKKMFPEFKDDVAENGVDLRIGEVYEITQSVLDDEDYGMLESLDHKVKYFNRPIGCVNDKKYKPTYEKLEPECLVDGAKAYVFEPGNYYFIKIDRPIHIPKNYIQQYYLRSSFTRCGLVLTDAIGDSDFNGTLMLGVYNAGDDYIYAGENERIIQAVTISTDGTAGSYNGSYQNDQIYNM